MRPGPDTPMNTSAPGSTSARVPSRRSGLVFSANHSLATLRSSRPAQMAPLRSTPMISPTPASSRILLIATPAAPTPAMTTFRSAIFLSTILRAFSSAARVTTAVPCWSSWNTGMSSSSLRRSSTSKHSGAAMSSRLMPPNTGAMRRTVSTISSADDTSRQIGKPSTPAKCLNSSALPSMTGSEASGPMSPRPEHRGAVGDDGDGVLLDGQVVHPVGLGGDGVAHPGHARRVGHRQVVAVGHRHAGQDLDLAAVVHEERAVEQLEHLAALDALDRGPHLGDVRVVAAVDDEVLFERRPPYVEAPDGGDVAAGLADGGGEAAQRARSVVEADPEADRVGSGRGRHGSKVAARCVATVNGYPRRDGRSERPPAGPGGRRQYPRERARRVRHGGDRRVRAGGVLPRSRRRACGRSSPSTRPRSARRSAAPASTPTRPRTTPWSTCAAWPGA